MRVVGGKDWGTSIHPLWALTCIPLSHFSYRPSPLSSSAALEKLRQERLRREQTERARAEALLAQKAGKFLPGEAEEEVDERKRGYNSQFHPQLARKRVWEPQ